MVEGGGLDVPPAAVDNAGAGAELTRTSRGLRVLCAAPKFPRLRARFSIEMAKYKPRQLRQPLRKEILQ